MNNLGTPDPSKKVSALLLTEPGRPMALAKIAVGHRADAVVEAEAGWLRAIGEVPEVEGQVPRLLREGTTEAGRRFLVTSMAPSSSTTERFTPAHARFLAALRHVRMRVSDFELSAHARELQDGVAQLAPRLAGPVRSELQRALADCEAPLLYWSGPYVASPGDFAPWNIRVHGEGIFVLDWKGGREGVSPLEDVLHFLLISQATRGEGLRPTQMAQAVTQAREFAVEAYPQWNWTPQVTSALALAYLLGTVLRHSVPAQGLDLLHPVVRCYWDLIQKRKQWMAV